LGWKKVEEIPSKEKIFFDYSDYKETDFCGYNSKFNTFIQKRESMLEVLKRKCTSM
jgi:hypothetical protein